MFLAVEVKDKYEIKFNKFFNHYVANGYDFIKLIEGLLGESEISRNEIKNLLEQGFINPEIFGDISVKQGKHDIIFSLFPAQIIDGKLKYLH